MLTFIRQSIAYMNSYPPANIYGPLFLLLTISDHFLLCIATEKKSTSNKQWIRQHGIDTSCPLAFWSSYTKCNLWNRHQSLTWLLNKSYLRQCEIDTSCCLARLPSFTNCNVISISVVCLLAQAYQRQCELAPFLCDWVTSKEKCGDQQIKDTSDFISQKRWKLISKSLRCLEW